MLSIDKDSHNKKYIIFFIDNYSQYIYIYLLNNKNKA